jgi:hypothetical protein
VNKASGWGGRDAEKGLVIRGQVEKAPKKRCVQKPYFFFAAGFFASGFFATGFFASVFFFSAISNTPPTGEG